MTIIVLELELELEHIQQSLTDCDQFSRDWWTDRSHMRKREVNCQTLGKLPQMTTRQSSQNVVTRTYNATQQSQHVANTSYDHKRQRD